MPPKIKDAIRWMIIAAIAVPNVLLWISAMSDNGGSSSSSGSADSTMEIIGGGLVILGVTALFIVPSVLLAPKWWFSVGAIQAMVPTGCSAFYLIRYHFSEDSKDFVYAAAAISAVTMLCLALPASLLRLRMLRKAEFAIAAKDALERDTMTPQAGVWPPAPTYTLQEVPDKSASLPTDSPRNFNQQREQ